MKARRSISACRAMPNALHPRSKVTREAVDGRLALVMAVHAEAHVHIDVPLGNGPLRNRTVTRRAFDLRADVRRMIEADRRFGRVVEYAAPGEVLAAFTHRRHLLDSRPIGRDRVVA